MARGNEDIGFKVIISLPELLEAVGLIPKSSKAKADSKEKPKADDSDESKTE